MTMSAAERQDLIARYREGHAAVVEALAGAGENDAALDARPGPDEWSAREVVHHLADSEMTSALRLRKLIAEDDTVIHGYDEPTFARRLYYDRPIAPSLDAFAAARRTTADILDRLSDEEWARAGTHTESGPYSVEDWLRIYAAHGHDHAEQIRRALAAASA